MSCGFLSATLYLDFCSNKSNVPADLQSAGIEYKNQRSAKLIFNPLASYF